MATTKLIAKPRACPKWDYSETLRCKLDDGHEGVCVITPRHPVAPAVAFEPDAETWQARCERLASALHDVLKHCVDRKQRAFAPAQQALNEADALLVEVEAW